MLGSKGFDLWADGYDKSVNLSEEADEYPFAGYKKVLAGIYGIIKSGNGKKILDVGFGTGVLSKKLYDEKYLVYGIDFSGRMIEIAKQKMSDAVLIQHDFSQGLPPELAGETFDYIICTYAIHHLEDAQKVNTLREWMEHLTEGGKILVGDVAFETLDEMECCKVRSGEEWDEDESYPVAEVLKQEFPSLQFQKMSFCSGVFSFSG